MKLTEEILIELGFEKKGKVFTRWMLDLSEDEPGIFSFNAKRIYFDVETVEKLRDFWKFIDPENAYPLPVNMLSCYQSQFNDLPKWVNFLAIDANGEMWGYEKKPEQNIPIDNDDINESNWVEFSEDGNIELIKRFSNYSGDWKTSLIER